MRDGVSVDTTMGLTPLEGLVMGTRSGDVDPGRARLRRASGWVSTSPACSMRSTRDSGLLGLSGIEQRHAHALGGGRTRDRAGAALAIDVFCYRVAKAVGALTVALGRLDALVFTGGIGEQDHRVRSAVLERLDVLGLPRTRPRTATTGARTEGRISTEDEPVRALVVPTDEELVIARDTPIGCTR